MVTEVAFGNKTFHDINFCWISIVLPLIGHSKYGFFPTVFVWSFVV